MTGTVQDPGVPSVMRIGLEGQIYLPLEIIAFYTALRGHNIPGRCGSGNFSIRSFRALGCLLTSPAEFSVQSA